jgi:hypothetical protein
MLIGSTPMWGHLLNGEPSRIAVDQHPTMVLGDRVQDGPVEHGPSLASPMRSHATGRTALPG